MRDETRGCVFVGRTGIGDCTQDELVIGGEEAVCWLRSVVLGLVIAPAVGTGFLLEDLGDWARGVEGWLPICGILGGRNWTC